MNDQADGLSGRNMRIHAIYALRRLGTVEIAMPPNMPQAVRKKIAAAMGEVLLMGIEYGLSKHTTTEEFHDEKTAFYERLARARLRTE